jgi:hypothetical protein
VPIFAVFYALIAKITNVLLEKKNLSTATQDYYDLAYIEDGEKKSLSDKNNNKFNASKEADTFNKIFNFEGIKEKLGEKRSRKEDKKSEKKDNDNA